MKYKCLVFDHDDTVVNSTATIHHPCFLEFLASRFQGQTCTLEEYFTRSFEEGFVTMCREHYGMEDKDFDDEVIFWREYVEKHIPVAYDGIREIMERQKAEGGLVCVASHSFDFNIRRDYAANGLPSPDAVYGWERPTEERKPSPFPLLDIMKRFSLAPEDILMIDDLKPGYDMAQACGVDFAAVGWANDIKLIEDFMRGNCKNYFKSVAELAAFLRA